MNKEKYSSKKRAPIFCNTTADHSTPAIIESFFKMVCLYCYNIIWKAVDILDSGPCYACYRMIHVDTS